MVDKQVTVSKEDIGGKEVEGAELKVVNKDGIYGVHKSG